MGGFIGYPIGGLLGAAVAGLSDLPTASVIGAGVAVAVIAGFQAMALGLRSDRPTALRWVGISAIAGAVGWLVARAIVPAADGVIDALVVGGVSGLAIGIGQLVAMGSRGRVWLLWPAAFALAWAAGMRSALRSALTRPRGRSSVLPAPSSPKGSCSGPCC